MNQSMVMVWSIAWNAEVGVFSLAIFSGNVVLAKLTYNFLPYKLRVPPLALCISISLLWNERCTWAIFFSLICRLRSFAWIIYSRSFSRTETRSRNHCSLFLVFIEMGRCLSHFLLETYKFFRLRLCLPLPNSIPRSTLWVFPNQAVHS